MPRVLNVHRRLVPVDPETVAPLLDGLSGPDDRLWPHHRWPAMRLDPGLEKGAVGGHGPVRYRVDEYVPGRRVRFGFDPARGIARGFRGHHELEIVATDGGTELRHVIEARCSLSAWARWIVVIRPLHDALMEDALDRAERETTGRPPGDRPLSWWVRLLRAAGRPRARASRSEGSPLGPRSER